MNHDANAMMCVYRLRYQQPSRESGESDPATGYTWPGGELIRDGGDRVEFGSAVTRYYMTYKALQRKVKKILDPKQGEDYGLEPHAGRVVSVEMAPVGEWQEVAP